MYLIYKNEYYKIKEACIKVRSALGNGFLEKIYENALKIELNKMNFIVESQKQIKVKYCGIIIGNYYADLFVDYKIIIEIKCVNTLLNFHKAQLLNYLKATGLKLGLIINFPNNRRGFEIERIPNFIIDY